MAKKKRFTVIGAGNGGKAMAAHLALKGFPVIWRAMKGVRMVLGR